MKCIVLLLTFVVLCHSYPYVTPWGKSVSIADGTIQSPFLGPVIGQGVLQAQGTGGLLQPGYQGPISIYGQQPYGISSLYGIGGAGIGATSGLGAVLQTPVGTIQTPVVGSSWLGQPQVIGGAGIGATSGLGAVLQTPVGTIQTPVVGSSWLGQPQVISPISGVGSFVYGSGSGQSPIWNYILKAQQSGVPTVQYGPQGALSQIADTQWAILGQQGQIQQQQVQQQQLQLQQEQQILQQQQQEQQLIQQVQQLEQQKYSPLGAYLWNSPVWSGSQKSGLNVWQRLGVVPQGKLFGAGWQGPGWQGIPMTLTNVPSVL